MALGGDSGRWWWASAGGRVVFFHQLKDRLVLCPVLRPSTVGCAGGGLIHDVAEPPYAAGRARQKLPISVSGRPGGRFFRAVVFSAVRRGTAGCEQEFESVGAPIP
jgi:hypothetical protein